MSDTITINIDGDDYEVQRNQPLIEAIREAGIEVPNFCYHPDLPVAGNCRICLVEVEGPRGSMLGISCHMRPMPGMKVKTERSSQKVVEGRKGVMEFLLVNHPLDCPICDKAGECSLQEHYMGQGRHESRLEDEVGKVYKGGVDHRFVDTRGVSRGGKNIDLGETVVLDQERCILCSRCVRFMRDVAGDEQLYLAGRGDHAYITTFPGDPLEHDYDLNVTDICPVGALTGKHFRFQQRVWFLKKAESIAPDDSLGANLTIEYNNDAVWRLMPRRNPDVNKSWIHNDTRLLYQQLDQNRLTEGLVDGKQASLADAVAAARQALGEARRIAVVASGHLTNEDNVALLALAEELREEGSERAEVFFGSWLPVGEPDGIARSGDPVANRQGCEWLGLTDNLDELARRAGEFDCVLIAGHDLVGADAAKAAPIMGIAKRIVLASWRDATVEQASIAIGTRCWAEVRGTMVNCHGRVQRLQAAPICPNQDLEPTWELVTRLSQGLADPPLPFATEADCWRAYRDRVPGLADLPYRKIGPLGVQIDEPFGQATDEPVGVGAAGGNGGQGDEGKGG